MARWAASGNSGKRSFENVLDLPALPVEDRPAGGVARKVAAFALDHDAAALPRYVPIELGSLRDADVADLADQGGGLVVQDRNQRVGRLAIVVEAEPAADADRPRGRLALSQRPAADVDDVDAVVADFAVAGRPRTSASRSATACASAAPSAPGRTRGRNRPWRGTGVGALTLPMPTRGR